MINQQPILIAGPPRSGTTLLAGLLAKHGVWIGRGRTTMYPGTNPEFVSENQDIKAIFKQAAREQKYTNWQVPVRYLNGDIKKQDIEQFVPEKTMWLVKTSWNLIFADFWMENYPDALWLFPLRHPWDVLSSMNRHPGMKKRDDKVKRTYIYHLQSMQKEIKNNVKYSLFVDVKEISMLHTGEIIDMFNFVSIKPDWKIIQQWIKPELMSHG